ncbi:MULTISPECIES: hypothetical protein [unclassified Burkholderia]|uniref:hypothetical protein n=1 Tax=unclassified Burkholderia TaxID=2613784 RepID=UPI0012E39173|nr:MULTISPECIES: hypothetical protein [unclassified Burkholderia]
MPLPTKSGFKWTLRFTRPVTGKQCDAGLGAYSEISIAEVNEKTIALRKPIDNDENPVDQRNRDREAASIATAVLTFEKAARRAHEKLKPSWKGEKYATQ